LALVEALSQTNWVFVLMMFVFHKSRALFVVLVFAFPMKGLLGELQSRPLMLPGPAC
jgi:hypothetical protein